MGITWKELVTIINDVPEERQQDNVTIYDELHNQYFSLDDVKVAVDEHDVLDPGSIFFWLPE